MYSKKDISNFHLSLILFRDKTELILNESSSLFEYFKNVDEDEKSISLDIHASLNHDEFISLCSDIIKENHSYKSDIIEFIESIIERDEYSEFGWSSLYEEYFCESITESITELETNSSHVCKESFYSLMSIESEYKEPSVRVSQGDVKDFSYLVSSAVGKVDSQDVSYDSDSYSRYLKLLSSADKFEGTINEVYYELEELKDSIETNLDDIEEYIKKIYVYLKCNDLKSASELMDCICSEFTIPNVSSFNKEIFSSLNYFVKLKDDLSSFNQEFIEISSYELRSSIAEVKIRDIVYSYNSSENYTNYIKSIFDEDEFLEEVRDHVNLLIMQKESKNNQSELKYNT